jgi:hypothetical protein
VRTDGHVPGSALNVQTAGAVSSTVKTD